MTTQKIIDNIQTRLENLISERFTGSYQNIDISCSTYNPTIDTSVTITITVTDQNGDPISGFTVPLKIDGTSITGITTNSSGVATHTYNCTDWGNHKINVKSVSAFINVTGWRTITHTNYTLWINGAERLCEIIYYKSNTSVGTTWTDIETITDTDYRPALQGDSVYCPCNMRGMVVRIFSSGAIKAQATTATSNQLFSFHGMWHY